MDLDWRECPLLNPRGKSSIPSTVCIGQIWKRRKKSPECQNEYLVVLGFVQLGLPNKPWYGVKVHSFDPKKKRLIGGASQPGLDKFTTHYSFTGKSVKIDVSA